MFESDHPDHCLGKDLIPSKAVQSVRQMVCITDTKPANKMAKFGQENGQEPPRGLTFSTLSGEGKRFQARWREPSGLRPSVAFYTEKERWEFAKQWAQKKKEWGKATPIALAKDAAKWKAFYEITGNADPVEVARFYIRYRPSREGLMSLAEARDKFLEKHQKKAVSADAKSHMKLHLDRLVELLGSMRLGEIQSKGIEIALTIIRDKSGELVGPVTQGHHLRSWSCFFDQAIAERWIDHNPCDAVEPPADPDDERDEEGNEGDSVNILTPEEAAYFFKVNRECVAVGRYAAEAFGGLRYTFAARLKGPLIKWAERGIVMPGRQHKSTNRHYVDGWPENLWAWMEFAPKICWDIPRRTYLDLKRAAFVRAGLKPMAPANGVKWSDDERAQFDRMKNVFRHSFISHHLAAFKNPPLTLYLATKKSIASMNNDYRGKATEAQGKLYHSITP